MGCILCELWDVSFMNYGMHSPWTMRCILLFFVNYGMYSFIFCELWDLCSVNYGMYSFIFCELWDVLFYSPWTMGCILLFSVNYGMYSFILRELWDVFQYFKLFFELHCNTQWQLCNVTTCGGIIKIMTNVLHNRVIITSLMHDNHFWENTVNWHNVRHSSLIK